MADPTQFDDAISVASSRVSFDIDRASLDADRESLYADSPSEDNAPSINSPSTVSGIDSSHPKSREARSDTNYQQTTPFVIQDAGPAPPDYAAATAGRPAYNHYHYHGQDASGSGVYSAVHGDSDAHRNLFSNDGVLGRHGLFSPPAQGTGPHDMSDVNGQLERADEQTALLSDRDRKVAKGSTRRQRISAICRPIRIFVLFLVLCILALIIGLQLAPRRIRGNHGSSDRNSGDIVDSNRPAHPPFGACSFTSIGESRTFRFDDIQSFYLHEMFEDYRTFYPGSIRGHIWIRRGPKDQTAPLHVVVSYATTQRYRLDAAQYVLEHEGLELILPEPIVVNETSKDLPCIDVAVVMTVRAGLKLQRFSISTGHMEIIADDDGLFDDGFEIDRSEITGISRMVNLSRWDSREAYISTTSAHIDGSFALRDVLAISSVSGGIDARVSPREVDPANPRPASLKVDTMSGNIHVTTDLERVPVRDYQIAVETKSGDILGQFISSSTGSFQTTSGTMYISVLPFATHRFSSAKLTTLTISSDTWLDLLPPANGSNDPIALRSSHRTQSGDMTFFLPQVWQGLIEGATRSGAISLESKDFEVDELVWKSYEHQLKGHRGKDGKSSVTFHSTSGNVRFKMRDP